MGKKGSFSHIDKLTALRMQGGRCKICSTQISDSSGSEAHHIIPLSEGGKTTLENCEVLCRTCNVGRTDSNEAKKKK